MRSRATELTIFCPVGFLLNGLRQRFRLQFLDFAFDLGKLRRIPPFLSPVTTNTLAGTSSNSFEHELGRVGVMWNLGAISLEVVNQDLGIRSNITEVNAFTT